MFVVFPGECHPRNQAHPIGYEGHGCVYLATALSLAWLFLSFVSHPQQGLFALLLCMCPNWPSTPASASQRLVLQACSLMLGTWVVLFPLWAGPTALSWSWAWLIHPCHSTFRAQLRSCPLCPLVSSVSTACSLLPRPLCPLPCGFEGRGRPVPVGSVPWQPQDGWNT